MKFSVFSVMTPDLTPDQLVEELHNLGFDGVEWRFKAMPDKLKEEPISFWGNNLCTITPDISDEEIKALTSKCESKNIEVVSVTPYLNGAGLKETEEVLKAAVKFGATHIRLGVPPYNGETNFNVLFEQARDYLKKCENLCAKYEVKGLVETHHQTIAASASAAYRLVEGLDPDQIGVLFDPGNMVHEGYENHRMGMELLGPYLAHVHLKNAKWVQKGEEENPDWQVEWELPDRGIADWKQIIKDLKAVGYDGYIGIEDFSAKEDTSSILKYNMNFLQELKAD